MFSPLGRHMFYCCECCCRCRCCERQTTVIPPSHTRSACVYNGCLACYNLALVSAQHHMRVTWSRWCSSAWNGATRTRCRWSCRWPPGCRTLARRSSRPSRWATTSCDCVRRSVRSTCSVPTVQSTSSACTTYRPANTSEHSQASTAPVA